MAKKVVKKEAVAAAPDEHSKLVGGSSAGQRMNCPGSYQMEQRLPPAAEKESSSYADEGTACHEAMAYMIENDIVDASEVEGMLFGRAENPFEMTADLVDTCLQPSLDFFDNLIEEMEAEEGNDGEPVRWALEKRCEMPGIPDAFGTCDLVIASKVRTVILDWKFGAGVLVKASYIEQDDGEEWEALNPQLMYYGRAAKFTLKDFFQDRDDWPVSLIIVQPRARADDSGEIHTRAETDVAELESFRRILIARIAEATGKDPRINRGEHCRFAKCKSICPKWVGPVLDLTKLHQAVVERETMPANPDFDHGDVFAVGLELIELLEPWVKEFKQQAHAYMEDGGVVPGRKLVPKRANESYVDPKGAQRHAIGLGVAEEDTLTTPEVKSPAQLAIVMEPKVEGGSKTARVKAARQQLEAFTEKVSSGTTVAHEDDKREAVIPIGVVVQNFAEKLAAITAKV